MTDTQKVDPWALLREARDHMHHPFALSGLGFTDLRTRIDAADLTDSGFNRLPDYAGEWDGHTTEEKWERVSRIVRALHTEQQEVSP